MSATLAGNVKPMKVDAGPLGGLYVTGVLSGMAMYESNFVGSTIPVFSDEHRFMADVTNAQVVVQKVDGPIQFYLEGGAYSFPAVGAPYLRAGNTTSNTFGGLPVWFVKYAPNDSFSVQAGNLPTLIGAEYAFSFQNVNIERGLIWNQENIINRGVQANYAKGPVALSLAWSDCYFSNRYSWITGIATYTIDPPAGGDHDPMPAPAGFYDTTDVPTDGHLVHSLEHGFVVIWYRPGSVSSSTVDGLRDLARRHRWVLVAPRPSLPTALAATAWHRRLLCPDGASGPIGNFVTAFRNQGPEKGFV